MSIASQITTMQEHIEDIYDTFAVAGVDTSAAAKNIVNINANLKERLEYYLANGLDVVWNNWNKVSGSGTKISLNNTIEAKMDFVYKGNTYQETSILPSEYTQVDYITGDGTAYINTGKTLGTNFIIKTTFIHNQKANHEQAVFSTWSDDYKWFNTYIATDSNACRTHVLGNYYPTSNLLTIGDKNDVIISRNGNDWRFTLNNQYVDFTRSEISTTNSNPLTLFKRADLLGSSAYISIYETKVFESDVLTMDLIPCYRNSDNEVGMYDIIGNAFYTNSASTGAFIYGSVITIPNPDYPQEVQVVTGDNEVKVKRKNLFDIDTITDFYQALATYSNGLITTRSLTETSPSNIIPNFSSINLSSGTYYISMEIRLKSGSGSFSKINDGSVSWEEITKPTLSNTFQKYVYRHTYDNAKTLSAMLIQFSNSTNAVYEIKNIMISTSSDTTYQPYQSATYPISLGEIELCKIGTYQDKIVKSTGKNLFDKNSAVGGFVNADGTVGGDASAYRTSDFIPVQPNTAYYKTYTASPRTKYYDGNKQPLNTTTYQDISIGGNAGTFTTPNNAYYLRFSYPVASVNANSIMLNEGTIALPYEPYGKVWYLNKQIGKVVLDGSENWAKGASRPFYTLLISDVLRLQSASNNATLLCNYLSPSTPATIWGNNINGITNLDDGNAIRIRIQDDPYTITTFKEWLDNVKPVVYYVLATPTITEITDTTLIEQLGNLENAYSYDTQTNITQTNDDMPFILDVTALKDLDAEDTTPALTTNRGLLFTQPPASENFVNDENDNSILKETINEEEPNIEDDNREEEEPVDFFEKEIINNDEEQEKMPTELIEIDNGQR